MGAGDHRHADRVLAPRKVMRPSDMPPSTALATWISEIAPFGGLAARDRAVRGEARKRETQMNSDGHR